MEAIKIWLGTELKTTIACQVLEFSIRRRTKNKVEFTRMIGSEWEYPIEGMRVGAGFSLRRWMIPKSTGWQGKAIYLDADMQVFGDIEELWNKDQTTQHDPPPVIWCSFQSDKFNKEPWPQTSAMLIDCAKARGYNGFDIDRVLELLRGASDRDNYAKLMHAVWLGPYAARIGDEWNHLNKFVPMGKPKHTRLIHYTSEPSQPHVKPEHPLAHLWQAELKLAIEAGAISRGDFEFGLSQWGKKEDWRPKNGLHPHYKKYLQYFPK